MAHHKRRRPKHQRSGCLTCKPHKDERTPKRARGSNARRLQDRIEDLHDEYADAAEEDESVYCVGCGYPMAIGDGAMRSLGDVCAICRATGTFGPEIDVVVCQGDCADCRAGVTTPYPRPIMGAA